MNTTERQIKLEQKTKDFQWYKDLYDKGHLYIGDVKVNEKIFKQFRLAIKCTKEVYDDNWDVDIQLASSEVIRIIGISIHFPSFTIRNSRNKSHQIKDMFVLLPFYIDGDKLKLNRIKGGRMTMTYAEYCSGYKHSHLNSGSPNNNQPAPHYSDFCTGSGEINVYSMECNDKFTEKKFTQYLLSIVTLVTWESLEGTPYKELQYIRENSSSSIYNYSPGYGNSYLTEFKRYLRANKENVKLDVNIYLENGIYLLRNDEAFDKFLSQLPIAEGAKPNYYCYITENGTAYRYTQDTRNLTTGRNIPDYNNQYGKYIYRGVEMQFKIEVQETKEDDNKIEFKLHPEIKNYVKKELEYELNKQTIRQSTINRYSNQVSNARESVEPDQVLV